ncbi:hypothetical protein HDU87_004475 [Geranomyces variabilis]|uniref:SH3 domain-containing protein n=1 Tax=Geranomyces variabilis TaxID=109894 RepID=A0AAD5TJL7_9FUNG|nr:hypothetical protein HDU87_004475 [Geranomyces variabilis]
MRSLAAVLLLLLASAPPTTPAAPSCIDISHSTACSAFIPPGQPVVIAPDALGDRSQNNISNVFDFDNWVNSLAGAIPPSIGCAPLLQMAKDRGVASFRFPVSFTCSFALTTASTQCSTGPGTTSTGSPLCQATCKAFVTSLQTGGINTGLCAAGAGNNATSPAATNWVNGASAHCDSLTDSPTCIESAASEDGNCGLVGSDATQTRDAAHAMCVQFPTLPCCVADPSLIAGTPRASYERLPMIAGLCGGFFFGVIALGFALLQYIERAEHAGTAAAAKADAYAAGTVHAHRARSAAAASGLWGAEEAQPSGLAAGSASAAAAPRQSYHERFNTATSSAFYNNYSNNNSTASPSAKPVGRQASRHSVRSDSHTFSRNNHHHPTSSSSSAASQAAAQRAGMFHRAVVIEGFETREHDEISLHVGDVVHVSQTFDDGWAYGVNTSSGREGVFPVVCLNSI